MALLQSKVVGFGRFLMLTGLVLLLLSAYHRALAKEQLVLLSEESLQLAGSFILLSVGIALTASPLKPITWQAELRRHTIDQSDSRLGFANIHHRGTLLHKED
ncbi:hypothetical protein P389DRAFT_194731 [Cystobasidium minutum MCA 4210]|uniref:uncharacterized protein n=1 Tax=Cystobasidium minutum MCA 4210 TaxID=1397322 RepID=UPI0034CF7FDA|eukprot:jgi/Rhomi1/194731/gm1.2945_g